MNFENEDKCTLFTQQNLRNFATFYELTNCCKIIIVFDWTCCLGLTGRYIYIYFILKVSKLIYLS